MHVRTRDGVTLHTQEFGKGPPVLLLHGLVAGNLATWYFGVAPALARSHRVVLFDFRGHGRSDRAVTGYGVEPMTRDLESVIDQVSDEPVSLVGHSFGGCVALQFALEHPERVRRLALVEAPLPPSRSEEIEEFLSGPREKLVNDLPARLREAVIGGGRRGQRLLESIAFLVQQTTMIEELRRSEDIPDARLATLAPPLLALYGKASRCRPVGARLARVVPHCQHVELAGGHNLPFENVASVVAELGAFLAGPALHLASGSLKARAGGRP
ncbi:MAG: alpha/beta hydrolase [Myxococcales bacterium]